MRLYRVTKKSYSAEELKNKTISFVEQKYDLDIDCESAEFKFSTENQISLSFSHHLFLCEPQEMFGEGHDVCSVKIMNNKVHVETWDEVKQ